MSYYYPSSYTPQQSHLSSSQFATHQPAASAHQSYVRYDGAPLSQSRVQGSTSYANTGARYTTTAQAATPGLYSSHHPSASSAIRREVPVDAHRTTATHASQIPRATTTTTSGYTTRPATVQQSTLPAHYTTSTRLHTGDHQPSSGIRATTTTAHAQQPTTSSVRRVYETRPATHTTTAGTTSGTTPTQYVRTTTAGVPGHATTRETTHVVRPTTTTTGASHYTTTSSATRPLTRVTPMSEHTTTATTTIPRATPQPVVPPPTKRATETRVEDDDVVEISTSGAAAAGPARTTTKVVSSGVVHLDDDIIDVDRDKVFDDLFNVMEKFEEEAEQRMENYCNRLMLPPTPAQQEAVENELKQELNVKTRPQLDKIWHEFARKEGKSGFIHFDEFVELVRNFITCSRRHGVGSENMDVPDMPGGMGAIMQMMASMAMGMMQKTSDVLHDKMLENYQMIATELYKRLLAKERGGKVEGDVKKQKLGKKPFVTDFMDQYGEVVEQGMKQLEATGGLGELEDMFGGPQIIAVSLPVEALFGAGGPLMLMGGPMGMDEGSFGGMSQAFGGQSSGHPYATQGGYTTQPSGYHTQGGVYGSAGGYQTRAAPASSGVYGAQYSSQPQYTSTAGGYHTGVGGYAQGGYTTAGSYGGGAPSYGAGGYSTRQYY